jgi:hypothetical protein
VKRLASGILRAVVCTVIVLVIAWSVAAVWIDGPTSRTLAAALCALVAAASLISLVLIRPWWRAAAAAVAPFVIVVAWWLSLTPSNTRDWQADVARLPSAEFDGSRVTIRNLRNFAYPSPDTVVERWEKHTYDLDQVVGFDLFLSTWGARGIAHTISSWEFSDGQHLAISIETRKAKGQDYSALLGFFRQYALYYVVADERDLIGVRASHRGEQVFLYRVRMPRDRARALLLRYLDEVDRLAAKPRWYNALTHNCTTEIRWNMQAIGMRNPFDWRILANGHLDELMYERGSVDTSLPFAELRARSDVTQRAKDADDAPDFSRRIREGVPGFTSG